MVVARKLAGMTGLVVGRAGNDAVRVVPEALRARGADCELAEVGNPEAGRRLAVDFRGRHDTLHRLVLAGPDTAAHHTPWPRSSSLCWWRRAAVPTVPAAGS